MLKQSRQCTYNVTLRRVRATIVAVENSKYYIFWECVCSLRYPVTNEHAPYCHLWPVRLYNIFPRYLINGGRGSSIGIATRYGLDGPGIDSRWGGEKIHTRPNHQPLSSVEVKERVELYLYSPSGLRGLFYIELYFTFHKTFVTHWQTVWWRIDIWCPNG